MATKRNKLKVATTGATIHCATKRRVTTTKHSVNVINDRLPRMSDIYKFFIMVVKNIFYYERGCYEFQILERGAYTFTGCICSLDIHRQ